MTSSTCHAQRKQDIVGSYPSIQRYTIFSLRKNLLWKQPWSMIVLSTLFIALCSDLEHSKNTLNSRAKVRRWNKAILGDRKSQIEKLYHVYQTLTQQSLNFGLFSYQCTSYFIDLYSLWSCSCLNNGITEILEALFQVAGWNLFHVQALGSNPPCGAYEQDASVLCKCIPAVYMKRTFQEDGGEK